jgi:hypothetical protein
MKGSPYLVGVQPILASLERTRRKPTAATAPPHLPTQLRVQPQQQQENIDPLHKMDGGVANSAHNRPKVSSPLSPSARHPQHQHPPHPQPQQQQQQQTIAVVPLPPTLPPVSVPIFPAAATETPLNTPAAATPPASSAAIGPAAAPAPAPASAPVPAPEPAPATYDASAEISDIDARLQQLQDFLRAAKAGNLPPPTPALY